MLLTAQPAGAEGDVCDPSEITLTTGAGAVTYRIELADDAAEQARGLMFRPSLPVEAGMLFVFAEPRRASFWMRNTMIPLDMIFIGDDGLVESVAARTVPYSEIPQRSQGPVRAVLEVNGGEAARRAITPGTPARHPAFTAAEGPHRCPPAPE